jgi:hypothetical protein
VHVVYGKHRTPFIIKMIRIITTAKPFIQRIGFSQTFLKNKIFLKKLKKLYNIENEKQDKQKSRAEK